MTELFSLDAEQSVLGGLLLEEAAWDRISDIVRAESFYYSKHQILFGAMAELASKGQPRDAVTVMNCVKTRGDGSEIDMPYLGTLIRSIPTAANIAHYAQIITDRAIERNLVAAHAAAAGDIHDWSIPSAQRAERAIGRIQEVIDNASCQKESPSLRDAIRSWVAALDGRFNSNGAMIGTPTGYTDLDECTLGLSPGELIILGARPSMGKTTIAMNIVEHVCHVAKKPGLVFSMEMPRDSLLNRTVASIGHVNHQLIRSGKLQDEDWPKITGAVSMIAQWPLEIDDRSALTVDQIGAAGRRFKRKHGSIGILMVDYIQLMSSSGKKSNNRENDVAEISRGLKGIARDLGCPVLALSQLNRGLEERNDKRPRMSDLRESGAIEQDADVILFLFRDEVYTKEQSDRPGIAEVIIAKQRNGELKTVFLDSQLHQCRFISRTTEYVLQNHDKPKRTLA